MSVLSAISTLGLDVFQLAFQSSPIFFVGGIAGSVDGGAIPIISYTEAINFVLGLLSAPEQISLDNFFAQWHPLPGSTLLQLDIGSYPFANQAVAANATISMPLQLSYLMNCPARGFAGYPAKLAIMSNLKQVVNDHAAQGGTYTCLTPSAIYYDGICTSIRDVTASETKQVQTQYQWDFTFPLLTLNQAQSVQNSLMKRLTGQNQIIGAPAWSGPAAVVGP